MRISEVGRELRCVAVGTTPEDAASAFGLDHDNVFLTSYAELADEVDLDQVISLDLGAGDALYAVLETACDQLRTTPGFSLRLEYAQADSAALCEVLDRHAIVISDVQARNRGFLVTLDVARSPEPGNQVVLAALDAADAVRAGPRRELEVNPEPTTKSGRPAAVSDPAEPPAGSVRPGGHHRTKPPLLRVFRTLNKLRGSRRKRAMIVTALAALALLLLAAGLLADPTGPVAGVLLALLIILVLAATSVTLMTMLLLARQVHAQTGRLERMLLRNRAVVQRRATAIEERLTRLSEGQRRLPFMLDYLEAMSASSSTSAVRIVDQIESLGASAAGLHLDTQRQLQAVVDLHHLVEIKHRLPPMGGWAASADFSVLMIQELIRVRPRTVVECGSGTTTLLLSLAVRQYGLPTRVVALEHLETIKAHTEETLRQHGVEDLAEVRLAPLSPVSMPGHASPWYAEEVLADLDDIGLLVVDGPPATTGDRARFPAVPLLRDRMSARCVIVVDDLSRPADLEVAQSWSALLPEFEFEQLDTLQKHAGVFRREATENRHIDGDSAG